MKRKYLFFLLLVLISFTTLQAGEKIHSYYDNYYDALSLVGKVERPTLQFHSFSADNWKRGSEETPTPLWKSGSSSLFLDPLEWFQSYNLQSPHGMNDGGLWQGKGYNSALSGGVTFESDHWDIVFYPEIYFSQNQDYIIQSSATTSEWGYPYGGIDALQRFGDESFWDYSWGQTQVRYNLDDWTFGLGTENIWLGNATQTAIVLSNNADGFPHLDIGLNKHETCLGDIEFRYWWGVLKSSDYIETVEKNSIQDFFSGVSFAWQPIFLPDFSIGLHKTTQLPLDDLSPYNFIAAVDPGLINDFQGGVEGGVDGSDGRASITWSWLNQPTGFEFYGEFAMEDFHPSLQHLLRRPYHASGYVLGIKQNIPLKKEKDRFFVFNAEFSSLVWSRDYYLNGLGWGGGFYRNGQTRLGLANEGQVMGAGYGSGGNQQHLELDYYAPFGMAGIYMTRIKWDDTAMYSSSNIQNNNVEWDMPIQMICGSKVVLLQVSDIIIGLDAAYVFDLNFAMINNEEYHGFYSAMSLQYRY